MSVLAERVCESDLLVEVDGVPTSGLRTAAVLPLLSGREGSLASIRIHRVVHDVMDVSRLVSEGWTAAQVGRSENKTSTCQNLSTQDLDGTLGCFGVWENSDGITDWLIPEILPTAQGLPGVYIDVLVPRFCDDVVQGTAPPPSHPGQRKSRGVIMSRVAPRENHGVIGATKDGKAYIPGEGYVPKPPPPVVIGPGGTRYGGDLVYSGSFVQEEGGDIILSQRWRDEVAQVQLLRYRSAPSTHSFLDCICISLLDDRTFCRFCFVFVCFSCPVRQAHQMA